MGSSALFDAEVEFVSLESDTVYAVEVLYRSNITQATVKW